MLSGTYEDLLKEDGDHEAHEGAQPAEVSHCLLAKGAALAPAFRSLASPHHHLARPRRHSPHPVARRSRSDLEPGRSDLPSSDDARLLGGVPAVRDGVRENHQKFFLRAQSSFAFLATLGRPKENEMFAEKSALLMSGDRKCWGKATVLGRVRKRRAAFARPSMLACMNASCLAKPTR